MGPKQREALIAGMALAALVASVEAAAAQGEPQSSDPLKSKSLSPQDPRSTASVGRLNVPLSDKLDGTDGVIRQPANIAPDMAVRPPLPVPGTTPVIPVPGTPGGDLTLDPTGQRSAHAHQL
ncbi:hypothetical protein [Microvirga aerophila]|uniref:Uncharacterized protein n=1 Tax=Microvirga aerophila TaxID=670291 RepID=A0A512C2Q6_9HYPH|nr:hypothetical protein [Microvirga aerophila]GEO18495.1 hypothetical protein MAE02_61910 [Microvirga aerophila]